MREAWTEIRSHIPEVNRPSRHEADRRVEVAPDTFVGHRQVQKIVRVVHLEAVRARVVAQPLTAGRQPPNPGEQVLVAAETRGGVSEIRAAQPTVAAAERIANRRDRTDP